MYLVRVTPLMNFTFSDDSLFLKKILGGGHKFSEFACLYRICIPIIKDKNTYFVVMRKQFYLYLHKKNWEHG